MDDSVVIEMDLFIVSVVVKAWSHQKEAQQINLCVFSEYLNQMIGALVTPKRASWLTTIKLASQDMLVSQN